MKERFRPALTQVTAAPVQGWGSGSEIFSACERDLLLFNAQGYEGFLDPRERSSIIFSARGFFLRMPSFS
jgi:hypothetical protein